MDEGGYLTAAEALGGLQLADRGLGNGLRSAVSRLVAAARAGYPDCDWQLTMNPETFLVFQSGTTGSVVPDLAKPGLFEGCPVWPDSVPGEVVICSPVVMPGRWDMPPEYFLDLVDNTVSTTAPLLDSFFIPAGS